MLHRQKTVVVGDTVTINNKRGNIMYIGELTTSNDIWIGVKLGGWRQTPSDDIKHGSINNIKYFNCNSKQKGIFIEPSKIKKYLRGSDNQHFSRKYKINDRVYVKSIKCKGTIKAMFYKPTKYINDNITLSSNKPDTKNKKIGKQYVGIMLDRPLGNNIQNKIKYFNCNDKHDYFIKVNESVLLTNYDERLSQKNLEIIIDHFSHREIPNDLILLIVLFYPAMDGTLKIEQNGVFKLPEECINEHDYYEYDSIELKRDSKWIGKYIAIKCFGDMILYENSSIDVSDSASHFQSSSSRNANFGGGGSADIYDYKNKQIFDEKELYYNKKWGGGGAGHVTKGNNGNVGNDPNRFGLGGMIYDNIITEKNKNGDKLYFGSCGGNGASITYKRGGKGGGIIKIICYGNIYIKKDAQILANGGCGDDNGGNGSGGTIYIKCNKLINYGKIMAWGSGYQPKVRWGTGYQSLYHYGATPTWTNLDTFYSNSGHGGDGKIIINGIYSEHGAKPQSYDYYGPLIKPKPYIFNNKQKSNNL